MRNVFERDMLISSRFTAGCFMKYRLHSVVCGRHQH